jgi:predicted TIM-barrel fold metal-dependent hydrolase
VYAGLAVASALIHTRRRYFSEIISELLYWLGSDRILFGSDYAIWCPKWIIEQFMDLELPEDLAAEANHTLSLDIKKKIMAENCARLYDIDIAEQCALLGLPVIAEPVGKDVGVGVG